MSERFGLLAQGAKLKDLVMESQSCAGGRLMNTVSKVACPAGRNSREMTGTGLDGKRSLLHQHRKFCLKDERKSKRSSRERGEISISIESDL